ncbi:hypothetical protein ACWDOP_14845 [Nocardia sp. NPDC003693]
MQQYRSPSTPRARRFSLTVAHLIGAAAAATITAGAAGAESLSRGDVSPGNSGAAANRQAPAGSGPGGRDTTGAHAIDPFGYGHTDPGSLAQGQHQDALRDYHARQRPAPRTPADGTGAATWTPTGNADGTGWAVCRPQASWC